jgi:hypothetical protein
MVGKIGSRAIEIEGVAASQYVHYYGQNLAFARDLRTAGVAATDKTRLRSTT